MQLQLPHPLVHQNNPEGYYYLGLLYLNQSNYVESLSFLNKAIVKYEEDICEEIHSIEDHEKFNLSDIYIARGDIYRNFDVKELMCADYQEACDLGNCEMFNTHCK